MALANFLTANISNFHNLALLLCHLFIGGGFRSGDILFDPNVFEGHLITKVDSVCPVFIPWQLTDITHAPPSTQQPNERNDHILQLIFFDPEHLQQEIDKFTKYFTYYRVFVFLFKNDIELRKSKSLIGQMNHTFKSNSLILYCNSLDGSVHLHWADRNGDITEIDAVGLNSHGNSFDDKSSTVFDRTFGELGRMQSTAVGLNSLVQEKNGRKSHLPVYGRIYVANFLLSKFNALYLNISCIPFGKGTLESSFEIVVPKHRRFYKELFSEYETVEPSKAITSNACRYETLYVTSFSLRFEEGTAINVYPSFPYSSIRLYAIFVYGHDFNRNIDVFNLSTSLLIYGGVWIILTVLLATILWIGRQKLNHRRNEFTLALIDITVTYLAGGNLRMQHKIEKWFFGILLIFAFFLTSILTGDVLDQIYRVNSQKMSEFHELSQLNLSIYTHPSLSNQDNEVHALLRSKIGPNIRFGGMTFFERLLENHNNSFMYVFDENWSNEMEVIPEEYNRDSDMLTESLGEIFTHYYLVSSQYVPDRVLKMVDKATNSMVENGIHKFYKTFGAFKQHLMTMKHSNQDENDEFSALNMQQIQKLLVLIICFWCFASFIFVAEAIFSKIKECFCQAYSNQRHH